MTWPPMPRPPRPPWGAAPPSCCAINTPPVKRAAAVKAKTLRMCCPLNLYKGVFIAVFTRCGKTRPGSSPNYDADACLVQCPLFYANDEKIPRLTPHPHMPTRVAILDDYQSVALSMADWSALGAGASVHPLHERIGNEDEVAERL